jgi:hypothetical protein
MLEGLAAWALKTYIGKYVNVNPDKVSIGLLSGVVELENVQLNTAAFNNDHEFPFELKCGYAGKIKLNISLSTLRYSPWVLAVDELFIVIGPKSLDELKSRVVDEAHEHEALKEKLDKLNNSEAKWFKEVELLGLDDEAAIGLNRMDRKSKLASLLMPMIYSLLNNIHVSLNKLHIRYEDATNGFSVDADIESIEIKNDTSATEAVSSPVTEEPADNLSFKLFELKNFSVYTTNRILFANTDHKLENLFEVASSDRKSPADYEFKYLIEPTAFKAQLVRDLSSKPLRKRKKPRIRVNTVLNDFNVNINEGQLKYFAHIVKFANIYKSALMCAKIEKPNGKFLFPSSSKKIIIYYKKFWIKYFYISILIIDTSASMNTTDQESQPKEVESKPSAEEMQDNNKRVAREWWLYLYRCVRAQIRRPNMTDLTQWSHEVNVYRQAIEASINTRLQIQSPSSQPVNSGGVSSVASASNLQLQLVPVAADLSATNTVTVESAAEIEKRQIETEWNFNRLFALRRAIFENYVGQPAYKQYLAKIQQQKALNQAANKSSAHARNTGVYGYVSWRLTNFKDYYFGGQPTKEEEQTSQPQVGDEEHNKIDEEVIGLINDSLENDTLFRRDSLLAILEFNLKNCSINLNTTMDRDIVKFKFEQSVLVLETLPRYNSFLFELNLNSFYLIDCFDAYTNFPNLVYPKMSSQHIDSFSRSNSSTHETSVFKIVYEHKPLVYNTVNNSILTPIKQLKSILAVKSSGLDIVFNQATYEKLIECGKNIASLNEEVAQTRFDYKLKAIKSKTTTTTTGHAPSSSSATNMSAIHNMYFDFEISAPKFM